MLPLDVVTLVMERLSFVDFHRARCVSSLWYSASKSCVRPQANPWLVLFPADVRHLSLEDNEDSCKLFDPIDHKSYIVRDLGSDLFRTTCLASYNSWFLMLDRRTGFYLLNILTRERIHLPSLESLEIKRKFDSSFTVTNVTTLSTCYRTNAAVLWVDERSKDYLVVWAFDTSLAYHKKGDDSWRVFGSSTGQSCDDMVFKEFERKLYVLLEDGSITAFDFSSGDDSPIEYASFAASPDHFFEHLAMTLSGQVLGVSGRRGHSLNIYKMDPKSSEWGIVESLGDEALLLDQRVTVPAKDGVYKNCAYHINDNSFHIVNIQTKNEFQWFEHVTASLPIAFKDARWFVPTFGG